MLHVLASLGLACIMTILIAACRPFSLVTFILMVVPAIVLGVLARAIMAHQRALRGSVVPPPEVPLFGAKPFWLGASERARGSLSMAAKDENPGALSLSEKTAPPGALSEPPEAGALSHPEPRD